MICQPCREAGDFNAALTRRPLESLTQRQTAQLAAELHAKCKGGTWCDCQHFVGSAINKQLVKQAT